jgi:hypothetical protein
MTSVADLPLCELHVWADTGLRRAHVQVDEVTPPVLYVRCAWCQQIGFRCEESPVVYTWQRVSR